MKRAKKIIAFLLAAVMVMSMSMTVLADENTPHTITINNATSGYAYEAYQVFVGDLHEGKLSNVEWGNGVNAESLLTALKEANIENGTPFANCKDAAGVAEILAGNVDDSEIARVFADLVAENLTTTEANIKTSNYADSKYTIEVEGDGYYFVKNKEEEGSEDNVPDENAYRTRYLLFVVSDESIEPKGDVPTAEKDIVEGNNDVKTNEASIGDVIDYKITGTMPDDISYYNTYYYVFTDTLSKGLTLEGDILVEVDGEDATEYFYIDKGTYDSTNGTTIKVGMDNLLLLNNVKEGETPKFTINQDSTIVITYSAKLNANAVAGGAVGNKNDVQLEYSNDPNDSGVKDNSTPSDSPTLPSPEDPTGQTPKEEVTTYTTEIKIDKIDGSTKLALTGAAFNISGEGVNIVKTTGNIFVEDANGTYYKLVDGTYTTEAPTDATRSNYDNAAVKYGLVEKTEYLDTEDNTIKNAEAFVDSDGILTFSGLGAGTYTITEIVTPEGYNSIDPITFTIKFDKTTEKFSLENNTPESIKYEEATNTFSTIIENNAGSTLPSTGGMGTTIFYIVGGVLVLVAVVLLVTRKRMKKEEV